MKKINLIDLATNYLQKIKTDDSIIQSLNDENFFDNMSITLSSVNIVKENRPPEIRSGQTHIHITGEAMQVFYSLEDLNEFISSTGDSNIDIDFIHENLIDLQTRANRTNKHDKSDYISMKTVKKVSVRKPNSKQVQLSKRKYDDSNFKELRSLLKVNDTLLFFRKDVNYSKYLLVAIPVEILDEIRSKSFDIIPSSTYSKLSKGNQFSLTRTTPSKIAKINAAFNDPIIDVDHQIQAVEKRQRATFRHQEIVTLLAEHLSNNKKFSIYAGNIDCFAVNEANKHSFIFEIKTIGETISEEKDQVRKAFSQLFYYDFFAKGNFKDLQSFKVALFSKKISKEHINFFEKNGCHVAWINDNNQFKFSNNDNVLKQLF